METHWLLQKEGLETLGIPWGTGTQEAREDLDLIELHLR